MLNSGYMLKMTFHVFNGIIPDSLLNTISRNPSFTHTLWSQFCSPYLLFKSMLRLSSSLWVFHPNVWRRSCPFSPLWAEGKYLQAALLLHWEDWKKWCRHFSDGARGWKTDRIFQVCSLFLSLSKVHKNLLKYCVFGKKGLEALMSTHFCVLATSFSNFYLTSIIYLTFKSDRKTARDITVNKAGKCGWWEMEF